MTGSFLAKTGQLLPVLYMRILKALKSCTVVYDQALTHFTFPPCGKKVLFPFVSKQFTSVLLQQ